MFRIILPMLTTIVAAQRAVVSVGAGHGHGDKHGVACVLDARAFAAVTRNGMIVTQEMEFACFLKQERN